MFNVLRSISRVPAMITLQRPSLFQTAGQVSRPAVNAAAAITVRGMKTKSAVRKRCPDCYVSIHPHEFFVTLFTRIK
ncbi:hypothetical protein B0I72DRAFT_134790 [Yarrowia lipolytica]|uniref:Uncharacterized protein n=1 Tax=Yarrowia lipolytica TaxID=4952 RepID=A0A371C5X7_YARLL|nr:hypothetical protein B0I71DRAFT_132074 [Yarrowia lipolytica]RDW34432.1 hypothetical protein B0I72DRAFT_134790 [Yarrowia lipolytica]RDW42137.1 hypothetical protein B0I73DRAFT_127425 [Yarrowia lipolytica]RDW44293.1 hypothetical protein B0I74DRAFT_140665 [Yarrowia lipolytica]RDW51129.1 hypothetical protein B0I75DRAFT_140384 [Yarrowia lipolytica]